MEQLLKLVYQPSDKSLSFFIKNKLGTMKKGITYQKDVILVGPLGERK